MNKIHRLTTCNARVQYKVQARKQPTRRTNASHAKCMIHATQAWKQREAAIFAAVESVQGHLHMDEPQEAQGQGQSQDQGRGQSQEQEDEQEDGQGQGQGQNPFSEDVYYQDRNHTAATGTQNDSSESDSMDEVVLASTKIFI